jgi:2-oxoglutarate dehydrogenase E2 component (dihydrolipoamide succinyltransferase)
MADVTMPQLGETVTEGTITRWFKQVGDKIEEDEALFEVSTDKVDSEVPSAVSGYLAEILVQEGETVDVGAKLAVISDQPAGGGSATSDNGQDASDSASASAPATEAEDQPAEADDVGSPDAAAEQEEEAAAEHGGAGGEDAHGQAAATDSADGGGDSGAEDAGDEGGSGNGNGSPSSDGGPKAAAPRPAPDRTEGGGPANGPRRVLSPVVRRLIAEHELDPDDIAGTGYQSRITRDDVLAHLDRGAAGASPRARASAPSQAGAATAAASPKARPPATVPAAATGGDDQVLPFSNIRRRTAEHMVRSLETSAHVLTVIEVDFENVDRVRGAAKGRWKEEEGFSLTYLPFVSRAVIDAIRDFPHVNASVDGNSLVVHRAVHLGFAVDLSFEGLIVPVIHDADAKRMRSLARELADLAARARAKKLNADEISGGTFTITNPGGYGTLLTAPVINQPNVAIISTDGVKKRPVVVELPDGSDAIAIHPVGNLALSFDHRAFDGAYASAFIARVRDILETRDWSQEL